MSAELPDGCESNTVGSPFFPGTIGGVINQILIAEHRVRQSLSAATGWAVPEDWKI
jgi:hypothetical protein